MTLLFDIPAGGIGSGSLIGVAAAVVFFLIFMAVAFVAFKMLKKTMKMAFRMAIVGIILTIAIAGSVARWAFSGGKGGGERPRPTRAK